MKIHALALGCCVLMLATGCRGKKIADGDLYDVQAALPAGLPYPVLEWKAITASVDRGDQTTTTLFGNDAAVAAARAGTAYPAGAVLGLVTWQQRDDPHWFGARIPGRPVSVEFVAVGTTTGYRKFEGDPWREVVEDGATRVAEIETMKAALAP
jgi:Cytochrome P460